MAPITQRKSSKVALFLTFEQAAGFVLGALPAFILTRGMAWWLQVLIVLVAAGLGLGMTVEIQGLAFYERMLWLVRGLIATRLHGDHMTPADLIGARPIGQREPARAVSGRVQVLPAVPPRRPATPMKATARPQEHVHADISAE
jgi:hypothetical protein